MLLGPGHHVLLRPADPNVPFILDWASVSASIPSKVRVIIGGRMIEAVYVGAYSPHTWWGNNPLINPRDEPVPGQSVEIEVEEGAILRIESNLELLP